MCETPETRRATRRSRARHERGETLVEFAISATLFFITIFGTLDLGWAVWQYNMLSNLAQEGARYAAVHGMNSGSAQTEAQVVTWVQGRAAAISGVTVTTTPNTGPGGVAPGGSIAVTVQKSHSRFTGLFSSSIGLSSTATMIVQR